MRQLARRLGLATCLLPLLSLAGCGEETPPAPEVADTPAQAEKPYRETIDPARTAKVATRSLPKRDTPLAEGATAPAFEALAEGKTALVVFYRGHW